MKRQIQALRARVGASERGLKALTSVVEKLIERFDEEGFEGNEKESGIFPTALARATRTSSR